MSNQNHLEDLYEIDKWIDKNFSEKAIEKKIKKFISEKYGKQELKNPSWNIKDLSRYIAVCCQEKE